MNQNYYPATLTATEIRHMEKATPIQLLPEPTFIPPKASSVPKWAWAGFIVWAAWVAIGTLGQPTMAGCVGGIFALLLGYCVASAIGQLCR